MKTVAVRLTLCAAVAGLTGLAIAGGTPAAGKTRLTTAKIAGGHVTDPRDNGRPVVLVAAALGVPTEVFRQAFSAVTPAGAGQEPDPAQVQANKAALLKVLAPYGVTNDELDAVSDYYRYNGSAGELWPTTKATARATIKDGKVVALQLVSGGAGYTSKPKVTVPGLAVRGVTVKRAYGTDLATNGRVRALHLAR
jgi:hypothetical protein